MNYQLQCTMLILRNNLPCKHLDAIVFNLHSDRLRITFENQSEHTHYMIFHKLLCDIKYNVEIIRDGITIIRVLQT